MFFLVYLKTSIMDKKENEKEREKTNKVHEMTNDAILFILKLRYHCFNQPSYE
jgi:hypothetical protein